MNLSRLKSHLERDEGKRAKPYRDTAGKLTAGIGRNLDDVQLSDDEIELMFANDVDRAITRAMNTVGSAAFGRLNDARQEVLVNMAFNLGARGLSRFVKFIAALEAGDYERAADEMVDSKWYNQVGDRGVRLEAQMRSGRAVETA